MIFSLQGGILSDIIREGVEMSFDILSIQNKSGQEVFRLDLLNLSYTISNESIKQDFLDFRIPKWAQSQFREETRFTPPPEYASKADFSLFSRSVEFFYNQRLSKLNYTITKL